jgi:hypothetical protein
VIGSDLGLQIRGSYEQIEYYLLDYDRNRDKVGPASNLSFVATLFKSWGPYLVKVWSTSAFKDAFP